jgi:F-type H+-transporting ATPase subunit epsilon
MAKTFKLDIVTPERVVFSDDVVSLVAPAEQGYYGVLAGHAPFLSILKPGEVRIRSERGELHYATSGGFMEVTPKRTVILSESAEEVAGIDVRRAEEALKRAKERLAGTATKGPDRDRAELAKERAENRLRVAKKYGKG